METVRDASSKTAAIPVLGKKGTVKMAQVVMVQVIMARTLMLNFPQPQPQLQTPFPNLNSPIPNSQLPPQTLRMKMCQVYLHCNLCYYYLCHFYWCHFYWCHFYLTPLPHSPNATVLQVQLKCMPVPTAGNHGYVLSADKHNSKLLVF